MELTHINPTSVEHEGFYYLEFEGEFFKGCKRCGGEGFFSFNGEHSRCYTCDNTSAKLGEQLPSREAAEKWCHERNVRRLQRERAAEAKRMVAVNAMNAYAAALKAAAPDVYDYLMAANIDDYAEDGGEKNPFIRNMAECIRYVGMARLLSTNMIEGVRKVMAQTEERKVEAELHPAPTGRLAVTGEIVSTKLVEGDYGTAYKILVKDDEGFKVWCSIPKAQADEAADAFNAEQDDPYAYGSAVWFVGSINEPERFKGVKGRRITFTATLEPSKDDKAFAFGSRPTKGAWL